MYPPLKKLNKIKWGKNSHEVFNEKEKNKSHICLQEREIC